MHKQMTETINERSLATIERIAEIKKHTNADALYIAHVQGYNVVINYELMFGKDVEPASVIGTRIVYIQIDSIMPLIFEKEAFWKYLKKTHMGMCVTTAKIRGEYSQGMILLFSDINRMFPNLRMDEFPDGYDLTKTLGIIKYYAEDDQEKPDNGKAESFPVFLRKTDQERLQMNFNKIKIASQDRLFTATQKFDGQSVQWYFKDGKTGVCSRNKECDINDKININMSNMNKRYDIFNKLNNLNKNISIQCEMYGTKINCNRHKMAAVDIAVFDIFDIDKQRFLCHKEVKYICNELQLPIVTTVFEDKPFLSETIDAWIDLANEQRYKENIRAEGIVCKTSDNKEPYITFKVISPEYLVKNHI